MVMREEEEEEEGEEEKENENGPLWWSAQHTHMYKHIINSNFTREGNTTGLNNLLFQGKRASQIGFEPMTLCL